MNEQWSTETMLWLQCGQHFGLGRSSHHHRLTRYHYHLQSMSKSWDFNQYLIKCNIKIIKIQLGFTFKLKIRGVIIKMWREAGGICWTPRFWTLAKRFVPLLYFTYFTYFTLLYWIEADTNPGLESLTKKKWARMIEGGAECWCLIAEGWRLMANGWWMVAGQWMTADCWGCMTNWRLTAKG